MPGQTDRYFQAEDNARELELLTGSRGAELRPIPSLYGHRAGNPAQIPADRAFLNARISEFLNT